MKNKKVFLSPKRGSILAYSLIILAMMLGIATSLSVSTILEKKSASSTEFSVQSLQTADSGMQLALKKINNNLTKPLNHNDIYGGSCVNGTVIGLTNAGNAGEGLYSLYFYSDNGATLSNCNDLASKVRSIKSVGNYKNTVRAVNVFVATPCEVDVPDRTVPSIIYKGIIAGDGKCWLDRNLGATQVATAYNDANAFGWYFQWGRGADGHQIVSPLSPVVAGSSLVTLPAPPNNFLTNVDGSGSWYNGPLPDALWQGISGTNNPCPQDFRLPTSAELAAASNIDGCGSGCLAKAYSNSALKLTAAGIRKGDTAGAAAVAGPGVSGNYWTSTPFVGGPTAEAISFSFFANSATSYRYDRRTGFSVRCIKN